MLSHHHYHHCASRGWGQGYNTKWCYNSDSHVQNSRWLCRNSFPLLNHPILQVMWASQDTNYYSVIQRDPFFPTWQASISSLTAPMQFLLSYNRPLLQRQSPVRGGNSLCSGDDDGLPNHCPYPHFLTPPQGTTSPGLQREMGVC